MCIALCKETRQMRMIADENKDTILDYITKKDKPIKEVTLILGSVGSGKTTLALLLTDNNEYEELNSKKLQKSKYIITDHDHKIGNGSMQTPTTIVPQLMYDERNRYYYYDSMEFSDSNKVNDDIQTTLLFRKLFNSAEKFKFIFTIAYDSMESHIKTIIENMSTIFHAKFFDHQHKTHYDGDFDPKYQNAIALVVTKAPNDNRADEDMIVLIRNELEKIKNEYGDLKKKAFVSLLQMVPVVIFRMPKTEIKEHFIGSLKYERNKTLPMIVDQLDYATKQTDDFIFSIEPQSKGKVDEKINNILIKIVHNFDTIIMGIDNFIVKQEQRYADSLDESFELRKKINEKLSQINSNEPLEFKEQLLNMIYNLGIKISGDKLQR